MPFIIIFRDYRFSLATHHRFLKSQKCVEELYRPYVYYNESTKMIGIAHKAFVYIENASTGSGLRLISYPLPFTENAMCLQHFETSRIDGWSSFAYLSLNRRGDEIRRITRRSDVIGILDIDTFSISAQ